MRIVVFAFCSPVISFGFRSIQSSPERNAATVPSQNHIREEITNRIVEALQQNLLPWRRPWSGSPNAGRPANAISKRHYSGVNPLLLELHNMRFSLRSRWWGTFKQWADQGCTVKRRPADVLSGQWGCTIVLCKPVTKQITKADGDEDESRFVLLRYFTVFNADQVEGEFAKRLQVEGESSNGQTFPDFQPADDLIRAIGADIRHGGEKACYRRPTPEEAWPNHSDGDYIIVPHKRQFDPVGAYYETILHELAHWSEVRLGWDHKDAGYAMGELVAEMAASFLSTELGVPQGESFENHAAYLKTWLAKMNSDPSFIFRASNQASKVSDFLLSFAKVARPAAVAA
jgi:antirestriction protein ArdC